MKHKSVLLLLIICFLVVSFSAVLFACSNKLTVTLDYGYGNRMEVISVQYNTKLMEPKKPERENYVFKEWQYNNTKFKFEIRIKSSIVLVAVWEKAANIEIFFDENQSKTFKIKSDTILSDVDFKLTRENSFISGFYQIDENFNVNNFPMSNPLSENLTLYVDWATRGLEFLDNVVTKYNGDAEKVTVPYFYNNIAIDTIGTAAFKDTNIKEINLSKNILKIGSSAFQNCIFPVIKLPKNLQIIGEKAFKNANMLENIFIPKSVKEIGIEAFVTAIGEDGGIVIPTSQLSKVEFEEGSQLKVIPQQCFEYKSNLQTVILPDSLTTIHPNAFNGCIKMSMVYSHQTAKDKASGRCILPLKTIIIGTLAFQDCRNIKEAFLPKIVSVGTYIFGGGASNLIIYVNQDKSTMEESNENWNCAVYGGADKTEMRTVYRPYKVKLDLDSGKFPNSHPEKEYYWLGSDYDGYDNDRYNERNIPKKEGVVFAYYFVTIVNKPYIVTDKDGRILDLALMNKLVDAGGDILLKAKYVKAS